jgi:hypothetical protein
MGRSWATCGANGLPRISFKSLVTSFHSCGLIFDWHHTRGCVSKREKGQPGRTFVHLCSFSEFDADSTSTSAFAYRQGRIISQVGNTVGEENLLAHLRASSFCCLRCNGTFTLAECECSDRCFSGSERLRTVSSCAESSLEGPRPRSAINEERYLKSLFPRRVQTDC